MTLRRADFEKMTIYRFRSHSSADNFTYGTVKPMMVILGDDEYFWVVTLADGERLLASGYEVAPKVKA